LKKSPACFGDKLRSSVRYNTEAYKTNGEGTVHPRTDREGPEGE